MFQISISVVLALLFFSFIIAHVSGCSGDIPLEHDVIVFIAIETS